MADEIIEETKETTVEEETAVEETQEETPPVETETPKKESESPKEEYSDREKRLYARMKKAEEDAKAAKEALVESKAPISDVDAIIEVQSATKGLDHQEISELKLRATVGNTSLSEARNDPNYQLWQNAYRVKVEKENAAKPSTLQPEVEREKSFMEKLREAESPASIDIEGKKYIPGRSYLDSIEKKEKILKKQGLYREEGRRKTSHKIQLSQNQ